MYNIGITTKLIFYLCICGGGTVSVDTPIDYAVPSEKDCARYKMHKYWAAKPWYVVSEYIRHFSKEGEIVLDPFCGSGVVGCEALINRRKVVLNDLNPMATFIAKNICRSPINLEKLDEEFSKIRANLKKEIMDMYLLLEPCPSCGAKVYTKHLVRGPSLKDNWIVEGRCSRKHGLSGHIRRTLTFKERQFLDTLEDNEIPFWFPKDQFPDGRETMRLKNAGMDSVDKLFTRRNLTALSLLYNEIQKISDLDIKELMLLAFSNTLLHVSKLKSEQLRPMSANSYYCMGDWIEENVWERFENRVKWRWGIYKGKEETNKLIGNYYKLAADFDSLLSDGTLMIFNRPAQDLSNIPDESIDYCFTDPPYGGSIQYYELTYLWRSWLKMSHEFIDNEITVNDFQGKKDNSFEEMLTEAFSEVYRVMKPGRWLSVTFNNKDSKIWLALLKACQAAGFKKENIVPQKPISHSFVQSWSGKALKHDLILNFRKPTIKHYVVKKNEEREKLLDIREIIITSTEECLFKNQQAQLSEIYETAVIRWINTIYGGLVSSDSKEMQFDKEAFDIETVDCILKLESDYLRFEKGNEIFYKKNLF